MPQTMRTSSSLIWLSQFKLTNITETPSPSLEFWCNDENWIGHRNVRWYKLPDAAVKLRWFYWIILPWQLQDIILIFSHPATHHLPDSSQIALLLWHHRKHKLLLTLVVEHKMTVSTAWCGRHSSTNYVCWIQPTYTIHNPHNGPSFNIGGRHLEGYNPQKFKYHETETRTWSPNKFNTIKILPGTPNLYWNYDKGK